MYIFIDESGIHKNTDHSAFALVYVAVEDNQELERQVQKLEQRLRIKAFHWTDSGWMVKRKFMEEALALEFTVKVAIMKNPIQPEATVLRVMEHLIIERNVTRITIDGKKPKRYEHILKKALRDKGVSVKKLKTVHDTQCAGIRIADMVAGMVRSHADGKNIEKIEPYIKRLTKKIIITIEG